MENDASGDQVLNYGIHYHVILYLALHMTLSQHEKKHTYSGRHLQFQLVVVFKHVCSNIVKP